MRYTIKLETAKQRIQKTMDSYTVPPHGWRPGFPGWPPQEINIPAALKNVIDNYYRQKDRIKQEDRSELKAWFDQAYEVFGRYILSIKLKLLAEKINAYILSDILSSK